MDISLAGAKLKFVSELSNINLSSYAIFTCREEARQAKIIWCDLRASIIGIMVDPSFTKEFILKLYTTPLLHTLQRETYFPILDLEGVKSRFEELFSKFYGFEILCSLEDSYINWPKLSATISACAPVLEGIIMDVAYKLKKEKSKNLEEALRFLGKDKIENLYFEHSIFSECKEIFGPYEASTLSLKIVSIARLGHKLYIKKEMLAKIASFIIAFHIMHHILEDFLKLYSEKYSQNTSHPLLKLIESKISFGESPLEYLLRIKPEFEEIAYAYICALNNITPILCPYINITKIFEPQYDILLQCILLFENWALLNDKEAILFLAKILNRAGITDPILFINEIIKEVNGILGRTSMYVNIPLATTLHDAENLWYPIDFLVRFLCLNKRLFIFVDSVKINHLCLKRIVDRVRFANKLAGYSFVLDFNKMSKDFIKTFLYNCYDLVIFMNLECMSQDMYEWFINFLETFEGCIVGVIRLGSMIDIVNPDLYNIIKRYAIQLPDIHMMHDAKSMYKSICGRCSLYPDIKKFSDMCNLKEV